MPSRPSLRLALLSLFLSLGIAACGGGGGAAGTCPEELRVQFSPATLEASFFHNQQYLGNTSRTPPSVISTGTVSPLPSSPVWVRILVDAPISPDEVGFVYDVGDTFTLGIDPPTSLAEGTYTGNLTMAVYADSGYTRRCPVDGGVLPFTLQVGRELTVQVEVDGQESGVALSSSDTAVTMVSDIDHTISGIYWDPTGIPAPKLTLHPGQVLTLRASLPVTWTSPDQLYPYGSLWSAPTVTETTLTQTVAALPEGSSGIDYAPYVAMPMTGTQWGAGMTISVQP